MDILYLVMPAYNEQANIENVVREWYPVLEGKDEASRLVVADFGSTDRTHEILERLSGTDFPQLIVLENDNRLHGPKLIALYDYAIRNGADYIFQTDSDGQTSSAEFDDFWQDRDQFDAIIGNRTVREDGKSRAFVERVVCRLLKHYFGVKVPDANAPFRLMKTSVAAKYLDRLPRDYFLPNIMMTAFFSYYKEKLVFRKISFKPRAGGENAINIPAIVKIGWKAMGEFRKFKKQM